MNGGKEMKRLGVILAAFVLMGSLSGTACGGETTEKGENSIAQGLYEWERESFGRKNESGRYLLRL